jgi:hypothetical protein
MTTPPQSPPVADQAPSDLQLTDYDRQHLITYLRLLDAERDDAPWREVARVVLKLDPTAQRSCARDMAKPSGARPLDSRQRLSDPAPEALKTPIRDCRTGNARCANAP